MPPLAAHPLLRLRPLPPRPTAAPRPAPAGQGPSSPPIFIPNASPEDDDAAASPDSAAEYREYVFWRRMARDKKRYGYPAPDLEARAPNLRRPSVTFADAAPSAAATSLIFAMD